MIMRAMAIGFGLWLLNAAIFRFAGQYFFYPSTEASYIVALFAGVALIGAVIAFVVLKLLREAPGDECEAAVSLAMPSLLLNALLTHEFAEIFDNLNEGLDGLYGPLAMIYASSMIFTGLLMTRISPVDERV
jgi:hypothetical protein